MRITGTFVVACLLLATAVGVVMAQPGPVIRQPVVVRETPTIREVKPVVVEATPLQLSQRFEMVLTERNVPGQKNAAAVDRFRELPLDLQQNLLAVMDESYAQAVHRENLSLKLVDARMWRDWRVVQPFYISGFWPEQGEPNRWSYAFGSGFNSNCVVLFDGTPVETHYLGMELEFFPNSLSFRVPVGATRDQEHDIKVRNQGSGAETVVAKYEIVAPRSYRGYHGWKFSNFGRGPNPIPWYLYSNYFGQSAVEYPNGTHRPAAQQWYDDVWSKCGSGGNCFGMSVASLRVRNHEFDHMYYASYFQSPAATAQPWVWKYDWNSTTKETVQQQQAAQLVQEVADDINTYYNSQSARDVFTRCQSLLTNVSNRPVLGYWGPGWGHAICPYDTAVAGDDRRMMCYDNNNPYRENESGAVDPDIATVHWAANTFERGTGNKAICLSFDECTPPNPHLPGAALSGPAADTVIVAFSPGAQVEQVTDGTGRRFFNPDGSLNQDPETRIPYSMLFYEMQQIPPRVRQVIPELRPITATAQLAVADRQMIFLFSEVENRSLSFDLAETGAGVVKLSVFEPGHVLSLQMAGAGRVQTRNLLRVPTLQIPNPSQVQLQSAKLIRSTDAGDRAFELTGFQNLGDQQIRMAPTPEGDRLEVEGAENLRFDLKIMGPVGQGMQEIQFGNIALQGGVRADLQPTSWGALQNTNLKLRMLNQQDGRVLRQQTFEGMR